MWIRHLCTVCVCAMALAVHSPREALAQTPPVVCEQEPVCSAKFTEAQGLAKQHERTKDADALQILSRLHADYRDPRLLVPIGRLLERQGEFGKAAEHYQRFIDSKVEQDPENVAQVQKWLEQTRAAAAVREEPPQHKASVPIYKRWQFWVAAGAAVAIGGIVTGTALGVYAREPNWADQPTFRVFQ